jgi:hypothetical protein
MTESTDKPLLDKDSPDEQQFEEYLKGDSSVSRQYRQLPDADVPADLDRLVLRQAEAAVKKHSTARPAWVRWTAPLAVAASAVLVLSIILEHGVRDVTVQEMASRNSGPTQAEVRKRAERKSEQTIVPEQAAPAAAASPAFDEPPPPPPPKIEAPAPDVMTEAMPAIEASPAPAPATVRPTLPPAPAPTTIRPTAPPAPAVPAPAVTVGESIARSADIAGAVVDSEKVEELTQTQPAAIANERAREQERSAAKAFSRRINADVAAPTHPYSDPEAWLQDIRQLRKDNKQQQADLEWRRFRAAFPDYDVAETDTAREAKK